jgi:hypothetical protein
MPSHHLAMSKNDAGSHPFDRHAQFGHLDTYRLRPTRPCPAAEFVHVRDRKVLAGIRNPVTGIRLLAKAGLTARTVPFARSPLTR